MSFNSCMISERLTGKIHTSELREVAAQYQKQGMESEEALKRAVADKLELARMDERRIVAAVRAAWEAQGGKMKKPRAPKAAAPAAAPTVAPEEATSETARRGEFTLTSKATARVLETARRGEFTVYVGGESFGTFKMDDNGKTSGWKARAQWAMDDVREAARLFSAAQAEANDPLAAQRERAAWIPAGELKTYTAKEAEAEWKRSSAGFKRAIMGRVGRQSDDPITAKDWADLTPAERKLMHAALNEDHFTGAWYTDTKGKRVTRNWMPKPAEKTAEELADEAGGERWAAMDFTTRESFLYRASLGLNQTEAGQAKFYQWDKLGPEFRKQLIAAWDRMDAAEARPAPAADDKPAPTNPEMPAEARARGADNKIFTLDAAEKARARLRSKLGRLNSGIDPELFQDGIILAGYHIEAGARSFAAYTKAMLEDLGENVRPYLRSFYEGVRHYPGIDGKGMSTGEEIDAHLAAEAAPLPEAIQKVVGTAPKVAKKAKAGKGNPTLRGDYGVEHIDGYIETDEFPVDSSGDYPQGGVKDAFLKDASRYLKAVEAYLAERGFEPLNDRKGKPMKAVHTNPGGPAVAGDAMLSMFNPGADHGIYVSIGASMLGGWTPTSRSNLAVMMRTTTEGGSKSTGGNQWMPVDLSAHDLGESIVKAVTRASGQNSGKLDNNASTKEQNGQSNPGREGAAPLADVATEEGGRAGSSGRAGRSDAGSRSTGDGSDRGADAPAQLPGARSDGASDEGIHSAATGADTGGRLAGGRARRNGSRVSGKDEGARAERVTPAAPNIPAVNFRITDELRLGQGGEVEKFNDNVAAIRTMKAIEAEKRRATAEEQAVMARYVGWGGLANAFPNPQTGEYKDAWAKRGPALAELLSPKEYALARRSTLDSHYTSQTVVRSMWDAARRLGYKGGLALESSMGVGNFLGLMPLELANNSRFIGVEYDSITARIAALLYPGETVLNSGFQAVPLADGSFDLAIGNPPFGEQSLRFQFKPELNGHSIHNQFFLASLDALKPGGLQVQVVSRYLLDKIDKSSRTMLAKKARLLGAIRLPDTAFKENARTEVVTDIVFLQRLTPAEEIEMASAFAAAGTKPGKWSGSEFDRQRLAALVPDWVNTTAVRDPLGGEPMAVNSYFAANPNMILGTLERSGSMKHGADITVRLDKAEDLGARLAAAIERLPEGVMSQDQQAIDAAKARHKDMSDALRIALAGHENGAIRLEAGDVLEQVIERETPEGSYELSKRTLTAASPWHESLYLNKDGKWYAMEVVTDEQGKPVKQMKGDKATKLNVYERRVYENESEIPSTMLLGETRYERLKQMVKIRDLLKEQLSMEAENAQESAIEDNRAQLAAAYNAFVKKHGLISEPANSSLVSNMPDGALVQALEFGYRPAITAAKAARAGEKVRPASATPAPILSGRVIRPYESPTSAASLADAVAINTAETGRVNLERIAALLGKTVQEVEQDINAAESPLLFKDPESGQWETRADYLTGQVKRKLNAARAARMDKNVAALEAVQPEQWGAESVTALLGSSWVPPTVYADFVEHITGAPARVAYSALTNSYSVNAGAPIRAKEEEWGSDGYTAGALVSDLLNNNQIKVTWRDNDGKTHIDAEKTALALLKAKAISTEWSDWVYKDGDRRRKLVEIFNEKFNTRVPRQHDGSHLILPGKVPDEVIGMRRHQKNAIWRGITERFMLVDHTVGAGKTFTAIARAMERRRMGLSKKPAMIVPNHMVEQFAADVYRLYPGAKVLAAGKKDFEKSRRRKLFAKIATGDFDIVIIPHSSFGFIGIAPETEERYLQMELDAALAAVKDAEAEAEENGDGGFRKPFGVKEAERLVDKITARMEKVQGDKAKDRLLTFEQMGIDDLTVDEAHEFKNLMYSSRLTGVKGMGNKTGSQKAFDLYNKVRVLRESPTGTVTLMTGTPISNSAVEMYNMMRYLAAGELSELGLEHFDAWRAQYVSTDAGWEPNETGRLVEVNRLGRTWSNMRSLMDLYYSFTDSVDNDDIKAAYAEDNDGAEFPLPRVKGGDRQSVVIQPTKAQIALLEDVLDGFDALPNEKDPYERNKKRLRLMDRARKVSLDVRAAEPSSTSDEKGGKLEVIADNVKRLYDKWESDRGTQLIFLDRSVPKAKGDDVILKEYDALLAAQRKAYQEGDENEQRRVGERLERFDANEMEELRNAQAGGWSAYQQIKDNLIARGIPANEIRFIQEAANDAQKKALFDAVNDGTVRVLIGSTPRMGAGTNVQKRLVGLHHADVTWKPSDIEQREGRIIRQGNMLLDKYGIGKFEVEILAYATERTIDAKMWSLNASKLKTINAIRKYDGAFSMDFEDEDSVSMAELAALASGDPLLLERVKLMSEIDKLELLRRQHARKAWGITGQIEDAQRDIANLPRRIEVAELDAQLATDGLEAMNASAVGRSVTVEGNAYTDGAQARKAVYAAFREQGGEDTPPKKVSISVGKRRLTSLDGAMSAVGSEMGDEQTFAMLVGDTEHIGRTDAARDLAELAKDKSIGLDEGEAVTVDVGQFRGFKLSATIERFAGRGGFQTSLAALRPDGSTLASGETKWREDAFYTTAAMRTAVEDLDKMLSPDRFTWAAGNLRDRLERAHRQLPDLLGKQLGEFPLQGEIDAKNARLEVVIRELSSGPSTPARKIVALNALRNADGSYRRQAPAPSVMQNRGAYSYNDPYENVQIRLGTTAAQKQAGRAAVDSLSRRIGADRFREGTGANRAQGSVLGKRLLANFVAGKPNQLVGQVAATPRDLAALAQVYRDPRLETFRMFFTKGDKIVGESGYTSRLPGAVSLPQEWALYAAADMQRFGADGYYILHNHPNGSPVPSHADQHMSVRFAQEIPGYRGHVVIDHNKYAHIRANGDYQVLAAPELNGRDFTSAPELQHKLLGVELKTDKAVAQLGKALQIPAGHATLVLADADSAVQLLVDVPMGSLRDSSRLGIVKTKALIRRMARESGSGGTRVLILPDGVDVMQFEYLINEGVFSDVVSSDGTSAAKLKAYTAGDFLQDPSKVFAVRQGHNGIERRATDRTIEVDGERRPISNSTGRPIADDMNKQLAFYRWFKDSKVLDEQGRPLVVYHGTAADFSAFDPEKLGTATKHPTARAGFFFSASQDVAAQFSGEYMDGWPLRPAYKAGANVMPVYLAISNPKRMAAREFMREYAATRKDLSEFARRAQGEGHDGLLIEGDAKLGESMGGDEYGTDVWVAFKPEQIKSATGNGGGFDPNSPNILRSNNAPYNPGQPAPRGNIAGALASAANSIANVQLPANYLVGDLFNQSGKLSWWHKTLGTMDNLARRHPSFAAVYEAVQNFLGDVSRFAVVSADLAPTLLPQLESISDVFGKNRKKALTAADTKAIGAPIFEGTLAWARDSHGDPVKVKDLEEQAAAMSVGQKAQVLLKKGVITDEQNRAWLASPLDFYDSTIERRYAESELKAGIVWSDEELRTMFRLDERQIGLYREFRAATDKSLANLTITEMIKVGGKDAKEMLEPAINAAANSRDLHAGVMDAAELLRDHFVKLAQDVPDMQDMHLATAKQIMDLGDRATGLMDHGYAPLSRFGKSTVYVQEENAEGEMEQVYFGMFESGAEAARMARQMKAAHPNAEVSQGTVSDEAYKLFAGVAPETIELFGSMIGMDDTTPATRSVYESYLQLAKNNRSAMKRMIQRKGIAGFSEDAGRVLANFIYSNARLSAGNANLGTIDEAVTKIPKQEGELTDAAVQLRDHIKNPEGGGNRLGGLMFAQFLGGSVASAMVNLTQPFAMTLPFLTQWGGLTKASQQIGAAIRDAGKKSTGDVALDAALKWATEEGIVAPQEVHYLQAQAAGKGALRSSDGTKVGDVRAALNNTMSKVTLGWGKLFAMAELANRRITFIAAYRTAVDQGIKNPDRFAQEAVTQTQGVYNSGNKPRWARGAIGGLLLTFKQYSISYLELLTRMLTAGEPGSKERKAGQRAAVYMIAVLFLLGGADGLPFEQDLEDAIDGILQRLGYNFSTKRAKQEFLTEALGEGGTDFVLKGISSMPGMPVDVSGRFGMGNLIPGTGLLTKKESYARDLGELAGPAGDVAKRAFTAAGHALGGDVAGAALEISPVAVRNLAKGADMLATDSYRDARGYKINETSAIEAGMKAIGFQPNSTADIQDAKGQALNMISQARMRSKEISEHWAQGIASNDADKVSEARAWRDDWNRKNPETPIRVNMPALLKRVRSMRADALNRTAMTAPKALKQTVRNELQEVRD